MFLKRLMTVAALLLTLAVLGIGGTVATYRSLAEEPKETKKEEPSKPASKEQDALQNLLDERAQVANEELKARQQEFQEGRGSIDILYEVSRRVAVAELERTTNRAKRLAVLEAYVERQREFEKAEQARFDAGRLSIADLKFTQYERLSAEIWLAREKAKPQKP